MRRASLLIPLGVIVAFCTLANSCDSAPANSAEQSAQADIQNQYNQSQPLPQFKWSQYRETLIEIETAQAHTVQTTSFGFNMGVSDPVWTCPSIGFPMATTTNLSNPSQVVSSSAAGGNYGYGVVGQMDPNGVYSGASTGTYVVCVSPDGKTFVQYWEGFVNTVSGPAVWDTPSHSIRLTGPSTVQVKTRP